MYSLLVVYIIYYSVINIILLSNYIVLCYIHTIYIYVYIRS